MKLAPQKFISENEILVCVCVCVCVCVSNPGKHFVTELHPHPYIFIC
jgi:hypothetical protein